MPCVSVIIAAHNGEKYIRDAIESVFAQDYPHVELWVIDNGSTDQTAQIVQSLPKARYHRLEIANVASARNEGARLSTGEYIAFLDQDDHWVPQKLSKQVAFLSSNPKYSAVIAMQQMYLEPGYTRPSWLKQEFLDKPQDGYLPSALMVRRSAFLQPFDTTLTLTSDADWFFHLYDQGRFVKLLPDMLLYRRIHSENNSNQCTMLHKELLFILKRSIARKRDASKNQCDPLGF